MIEKEDYPKDRFCGYCGSMINDVHQEYFVNTHLDDCEFLLATKIKKDRDDKQNSSHP